MQVWILSQGWSAQLEVNFSLPVSSSQLPLPLLRQLREHRLTEAKFGEWTPVAHSKSNASDLGCVLLALQSDTIKIIDPKAGSIFLQRTWAGNCLRVPSVHAILFGADWIDLWAVFLTSFLLGSPLDIHMLHSFLTYFTETQTFLFLC